MEKKLLEKDYGETQLHLQNIYVPPNECTADISIGTLHEKKTLLLTISESITVPITRSCLEELHEISLSWKQARKHSSSTSQASLELNVLSTWLARKADKKKRRLCPLKSPKPNQNMAVDAFRPFNRWLWYQDIYDMIYDMIPGYLNWKPGGLCQEVKTLIFQQSNDGK